MGLTVLVETSQRLEPPAAVVPFLDSLVRGELSSVAISASINGSLTIAILSRCQRASVLPCRIKA